MNTTRKTSKKALAEAVDHFFWSLAWVTGGTLEETLRQADHEIFDLEAKAAIVAALAASLAEAQATVAKLTADNAALSAAEQNVEKRASARLAGQRTAGGGVVTDEFRDAVRRPLHGGIARAILHPATAGPRPAPAGAEFLRGVNPAQDVLHVRRELRPRGGGAE